MIPLLINHPKGYSLTLSEGFSSALLPPLSASTYAARHGECADLLKKEGKAAWGHRTVQVLEYMPVVGLLVAIIERICAFVHRCIYSSELKKESLAASIDELKIQTAVSTEGTPLTPLQEQVVQNVLSDKERENDNPAKDEGQVEDDKKQYSILADTNNTLNLESTSSPDKEEDPKEVELPVIAQTIEKTVDAPTTINGDALDTVLSDETPNLTEKDKEALDKETESEETILGAVKELSEEERQEKEWDQKQLDWAKNDFEYTQRKIDSYVAEQAKLNARLAEVEDENDALMLEAANYNYQTDVNGGETFSLRDGDDPDEAGIIFMNLSVNIHKTKCEKDKLLKNLEKVSEDLNNELTRLEAFQEKIKDFEAKLK